MGVQARLVDRPVANGDRSLKIETIEKGIVDFDRLVGSEGKVTLR